MLGYLFFKCKFKNIIVLVFKVFVSIALSMSLYLSQGVKVNSKFNVSLHESDGEKKLI